ncbi:hypothetical protein ACFOZY_00855 [Chungangia koreensis]|uniref:Uncharacterized protein n=1 Tax=Chungangia koreensis TaxID=752657 RepID=A0ABV8X0F3_9LACT
MVTLPIHLVTALAAMFIYGVYLLYFDYDIEETIVSFFLLIFNVLSYFLYSFYFLRKFKWTTVFASTFLFVVIGLALWIISDAIYAPDFIEMAFWYYHVAGHTSYLWYENMYIDPDIYAAHGYGYLYSTVPAFIILFGYGCGRLLLKMNANRV